MSVCTLTARAINNLRMAHSLLSLSLSLSLPLTIFLIKLHPACAAFVKSRIDHAWLCLPAEKTLRFPEVTRFLNYRVKPVNI
jgi:hypothetical protein